MNADDGTFWMCFDDFKDYFKRFEICKYRDDFEFQGVPLDTSNGYNLVQVQISKPGLFTFSVSQIDSRCKPRNCEYEYSSCRIIVLNEANFEQVYGGIQGFQDRDAYLEIDHLDSGNYLLFIEMEWHETTPNGNGNSIAATCYGECGSVQFGADRAAQFPMVEVLDKVFIYMA